MVRLVNIKKNNNLLSANYIPENSSELGFISIDVLTGEMVSFEYTEHDRVLPLYFSHAETALKKLVGADNIPESKLVMWY